MFNNCIKITELNLDKFNTYKVIDMSFLFYNCSSLISLSVVSFYTKDCQKYNDMFVGDYGLNLSILGEYCSNILSTIPDYVNLNIIY